MISAHHQLFQIEKSFRVAKSGLQARPVYHRKRDSIEAHRAFVFAADPLPEGLGQAIQTINASS